MISGLAGQPGPVLGHHVISLFRGSTPHRVGLAQATCPAGLESPVEFDSPLFGWIQVGQLDFFHG